MKCCWFLQTHTVNKIAMHIDEIARHWHDLNQIWSECFLVEFDQSSIFIYYRQPIENSIKLIRIVG